MSNWLDVSSSFSFRKIWSTHSQRWLSFVGRVFAPFKLEVSHAQRAPRMQWGYTLHIKIHIPWFLAIKNPHTQGESRLQVIWGCWNVQTAEQQSVIGNYLPKQLQQTLSVGGVKRTWQSSALKCLLEWSLPQHYYCGIFPHLYQLQELHFWRHGPIFLSKQVIFKV